MTATPLPATEQEQLAKLMALGPDALKRLARNLCVTQTADQMLLAQRVLTRIGKLRAAKMNPKLFAEAQKARAARDAQRHRHKERVKALQVAGVIKAPPIPQGPRRSRLPILVEGFPYAITDFELEKMAYRNIEELKDYATTLGSRFDDLDERNLHQLLFNRVKARQNYLVKRGVLRSRKGYGA